jgi:C4-dicarboxylate-specific signal transduction histidine kinase
LKFLRTQPILRQVLVAAGVLIVLLGIAVFWSALKTRDERADEVRAEAGTIATTAAALLNEYFGGLDATASTLVRYPAVRSLDGPASTKLFQIIQSEQPLIGNVTLRDARGSLIASAVTSSAKNPLPALVLQQVLETGRPASSQLVRGSILNRNTVVMGYPVRDDAGTVVGVLGFSLVLRQLETLFAKLPLPEGSVVVLADRNNVVISRSVESEKYIGTPIDVAHDGSPNSFQLDPDGIERFHGNAIIDRGPWLLSVAIPRTEVLRRVTQLWQRNLLMIAAVTVFVLGLALWISWQTAFDLRRLQLAAGRIASGDLSPPPERSVPNREMADLQQSFVTMAGNLREARDTLDRQFAQERKMLEAVQSLQRQVVRQERLAAVGLLVSGIAHELNNPLQAILGTIEVVERHTAVPEEIADDIAQVKAQSNRARDIIRNLSRFSKQKPGPPTLVDLRDVISSVVQLRKRELDSASISLDVETMSVRPVMAAFAELEQVLLNFVVNAQQAVEGTGRRNGRMLIRLSDVGRKIRLEVWDDGPGVPAEHEQKLFQPFFTTKPVGAGTGLGLSVSYGIVDAYGGVMGYLNNEWGGATFFVELPVAGEAAETQDGDDRTSVLRGRISSRV